MSDKHLNQRVKSAWHGFLQTYEPLRPELYRYCRHRLGRLMSRASFARVVDEATPYLSLFPG